MCIGCCSKRQDSGLGVQTELAGRITQSSDLYILLRDLCKVKFARSRSTILMLTYRK